LLTLNVVSPIKETKFTETDFIPSDEWNCKKSMVENPRSLAEFGTQVNSMIKRAKTMIGVAAA
jgi:hypothetical protein